MEDKKILEAIKQAREKGKKRKFSQSFDLFINLKEVDFKKGFKFDEYFVLPEGRGKDVKICVFVDKDLITEAKKNCDFAVLKDDFPEYQKSKKDAKKLVRNYDTFIAQATIMPNVAKTFGKFLAVKGKMPSPKAGFVFPPKTDFKAILPKIKNTIKIKALKQPVIHCSIGTEKMNDEQILKNIKSIYDFVVKKLPREKENIKSVMIKLTMGPVVRLV